MKDLKVFNMTRKEFETAFIIPLKKEFGYECYWNGRHLVDKGIGQIEERDTVGRCCSALEGRPIILKYRKNRVMEMISTLIHEYVHAELHYYESGLQDIEVNLEEYEAERLSYEVLSHFSANVRKPRTIDYYYNQSDESQLVEYKSLNRETLLKDFLNRAINALNHEALLLKSIYNNNNPNYKYKVECPLCNRSWHYARKSEIIKQNGKGFMCSFCEEDSYDKLIVYHL